MGLIKIEAPAKRLGYRIIEESKFNPEIHSVYKEKTETTPINPLPVIVEVPTLIKLTTASLDELISLDGVGKATGEQIIELRDNEEITFELLRTKFPRIKWEELPIEI